MSKEGEETTSSRKPENPIFNWLINYHYYINLKLCLPYIENGRLIQQGRHLDECDDEVEAYKGVLIVADGSTLINRLEHDRVIHDNPADLEFTTIASMGDLFRYLANQKNSDGAYLFNKESGKITRVCEINNSMPNMPDESSMHRMIPDDFVSFDKKIMSYRNIGTKTRLAIKIPHAYDDSETYQIKRSSYGKLGMGKVTHFNKQGLVEEFFFNLDIMATNSTSQMSKISGMHRKYNKSPDGRLVKVSESVITDFEFESILNPLDNNIMPGIDMPKTPGINLYNGYMLTKKDTKGFAQKT